MHAVRSSSDPHSLPQLLIVSSDVSKLLPIAAALSHLLSPLSFSGVFIPFLPWRLHPDPATLVNETPTPFIIGLEKQACFLGILPSPPHHYLPLTHA